MKIVIVGGYPIQDRAAVYEHGEDWEYWGINAIHIDWLPVRKWSRWFNLHHYKTLKTEWKHGLAAEIAWHHIHNNVPCYVLESWDGIIPNERIFPRKKLERMSRGWYHCGSFDWMVAYAVSLGAEEIALHGIGLAMESGEPMSAHACLEYWCGYAEGKGCKVTTKDCNLFYNWHLVRDHKAYGYDDWDMIEDRT